MGQGIDGVKFEEIEKRIFQRMIPVAGLKVVVVSKKVKLNFALQIYDAVLALLRSELYKPNNIQESIAQGIYLRKTKSNMFITTMYSTRNIR